MKECLKTFLMYIVKILLFPLKIFPIRNYIMFCSNSGDSYSCNPKYLYNYLIQEDNYINYKFIWAFKNPDKYHFLSDNKTILCKYRSLKFYYFKVVSKIYISNSIEGNETPKKKKQIRIQTWHGGGCYKRVGLSEKKVGKLYKLRTKNNIKNTDYFVSSSKLFSKFVINGDFGYTGSIINCGMPRNDILLDYDKSKYIRDKVVNELKIEKESLIVLYAPTWRYDESKIENIDFDKLVVTLENKFNKKVVILYRAHLHMNNRTINKLLNVSDYPDMQELLIASDVLISDYSSAIWDYSFTYKPCFLFCPDLDYYIENRGFVEDIFSWGFPVSRNNDELIVNVEKFDSRLFVQEMNNHHAHLGSYENGNACKTISNVIKKITNNGRCD